MKKTNAQICEQYAQQVEKLKQKLTTLREKWEEMDLYALDAEKDDNWDSDVVREFVLDMQEAENALDGII